MITGFNTDIQHGGVTYHVQTEDKGLETPLILSLVYVGGAILASKRSPYQDLIESGFDEHALTERLQRQHKLICAAIRAGRIEDLKRMNAQESGTPHAPAEPPSQQVAAQPAQKGLSGEVAPVAAPPDAPSDGLPREPVYTNDFKEAIFYDLQTPFAPGGVGGTNEVAPPEPYSPPEPFESPEPEEAAAVEAVVEEVDDELYLTLLDDEGDFRAGQLATIKIHVGRGAYGRRAAAGAEVSIKILGTTFRPLILSTVTDDEGVAVVRALLPRFTSGRAAIIIRVRSEEAEAELRRIIHQS